MSVFVPYLRSYDPFYVQREVDELAVDIRQTYGITVRVHEYPARRKVKQPYKNEWLDRDGDDEFVTGQRFDPFTLRLSCVIMSEDPGSDTARAELMSAALAFRSFLRGSDFRIYDAWTRTGFRKVRLEEFPEIRENGFLQVAGRCRLVFDIVLKINDPVTQVRYQNGVLVDVKSHGDSVLVLAAEDGRYVTTEDGKLILM